VRADVTGPALQEFISELQGVELRPITTQELEAAREGVIRSLPGSFESVGGLASAAAGLFWKDRPLDHYEKMIEGYENADAAAVQAAAEKYFDPAQMHIVLVGDPAVIRDQVVPLGLGELRERNPVVPAKAR
jgi:predicted Zn-dependent peptidase